MKANRKQQAVRARLLRLGFTPVAEADFRPNGGFVEVWHTERDRPSAGGNTIRVVYADGRAIV